MCLVAFAWMSHPRYRLVVAANRDEFHDRPAAALGWWTDDPRILAGRDLKASGTWMGMARSGRFGLMTNYRDLETPAPDAPSRGALVAGYLAGSTPPRDYLRELMSNSASYAGFSLVIGDEDSLFYFSNRECAEPRSLDPGVYGLSNHLLDSPWPKVTRTRERLQNAVQRAEIHPPDLLEMLADQTPAAEGAVPRTGLPAEWEQRLSAAFVLHDRYGTRCSTVMLADKDGHAVVYERRYDRAGHESGRTRLGFDTVSGTQPCVGVATGPQSAPGFAANDTSPE